MFKILVVSSVYMGSGIHSLVIEFSTKADALEAVQCINSTKSSTSINNAIPLFQ